MNISKDIEPLDPYSDKNIIQKDIIDDITILSKNRTVSAIWVFNGIKCGIYTASKIVTDETRDTCLRGAKDTIKMQIRTTGQN